MGKVVGNQILELEVETITVIDPRPQIAAGGVFNLDVDLDAALAGRLEIEPGSPA